MSAWLLQLLSVVQITGWLANLAIWLVYFVCVLLFVILNVLMLVWMERRVSALIQERLGPNRVGPLGLFQTTNDVIKLIGKELIRPTSADKWVFWLAPILAFTSAILVYPVIPFGKGLVLFPFNLGVLFTIAVSSTVIVSIFMAGWGSGNKYSLLGGMRTVAQIISFEIPLVFSMMGVVLITGTMNLQEIVEAQRHHWFILLQPVAFFIYFISSVAELNRAPFDLPEAEQELVAGYHTEYSGIQFAFFFLAEYTNMLSVAAIGVTLFLGGYNGPFLPSWCWLLLKMYTVIFIYMWIRWTLPRIRIDKMMKMNWKYLIPLALLNLVVTAAVLKAPQLWALWGSLMKGF